MCGHHQGKKILRGHHQGKKILCGHHQGKKILGERILVKKILTDAIPFTNPPLQNQMVRVLLCEGEGSSVVFKGQKVKDELQLCSMICNVT